MPPSGWEGISRLLAVRLDCATDCSPCYRFTCPYAMECLDIAPSEVVRHSVEVLEECGGLA